jgi:hypothetical protein
VVGLGTTEEPSADAASNESRRARDTALAWPEADDSGRTQSYLAPCRLSVVNHPTRPAAEPVQ